MKFMTIISTLLLSLSTSANVQESSADIVATIWQDKGKVITVSGRRLILSSKSMVLPEASDIISIPTKVRKFEVIIANKPFINTVENGTLSKTFKTNGKEIEVIFKFTHNSYQPKINSKDGLTTLEITIEGPTGAASGFYYFDSRENLGIQNSIVSTNCQMVSENRCVSTSVGLSHLK